MRLSPALFLITTCFLISCGATGEGPLRHQAKAAVNGLSEENSFQIAEEDLCPVCGMYVKKYEKFACAVQLTDERVFYTCGSDCLVRTWLTPESYLDKNQSNISKMFVQEFFSGKVMDTNEVVFISGSDFIGPMGRTVAPVTPDQVETYKSRHGGDKIFKLRSLTPEAWAAR